MGSLFLSPPRDWSAVTLDEMRDHISARAADAPDRPACHWIRGSGDVDGVAFDESANFCPPCAEEKVRQIRRNYPKQAREHGVRVDGGFNVEHDSPPYCETCGVTLDGTLTEHGIKREVEAQTCRAEPLTPLDWAMLDLAMIDVLGEGMTLAEYVAQPNPKTIFAIRIRTKNLDIWQRVAPVVIADMAQRGAAR